MAVRVLVVWEPMLPTDWDVPSGMVQSRISDSRVVQFWDKDHLVAKELKQQFPSSRNLCCQRNGVLWDVAAVYPAGVEWGVAAPKILRRRDSQRSGRRASISISIGK